VTPAPTIPPPSSLPTTTGYLFLPSAHAADQAQAVLVSQRADRERIHQEKVAAEKKLQDSLYVVDHFRLDLERLEKQLQDAERRIGETRAQMRANGLYPSSGIRM
jgi:hypothetical protein